MNLSRALAPSFRISLAVLSAGALHSAVLAAGADDAQKAPATPAEQRVAADVAKVTEQYLVAPKAASELGCRIEWQTAASVPAGGALRKVDSSADAVLALNNRNELTLIRPETGDAAWTVSAAVPIDRVIRMGVFSYAGRGGDENTGGNSDGWGTDKNQQSTKIRRRRSGFGSLAVAAAARWRPAARRRRRRHLHIR
jgi:hypothetical protein